MNEKNILTFESHHLFYFVVEPQVIIKTLIHNQIWRMPPKLKSNAKISQKCHFTTKKEKNSDICRIKVIVFNMVPATRIELARVASQDSKSCVSTYFTMPASLNEYSIFSYLFQYYISLCCKRFQWIILANIINLLAIILYHVLSFAILQIIGYNIYAFKLLLLIITHSIIMTIIYTTIIYYLSEYLFSKFEMKQIR